MKRLRFLAIKARSERGATMIEYLLMFSLICYVVLLVIGDPSGPWQRSADTFTDIGYNLGGGTEATIEPPDAARPPGGPNGAIPVR